MVGQREREQDGDGVVLAGVGVDDDCAAHRSGGLVLAGHDHVAEVVGAEAINRAVDDLGA